MNFDLSTTRTRSLRWLLGLGALVLATSLSMFAQEATILGTVNDSSGAAVPNVQVVITNTETGIVTNVNTSGDGQYVAPSVHIGHYTVRVAASGFKIAEQKNITLSVGDRTRIDFKLQVGAAQEEVTVEANAVSVQTDSGEISNLITGRQISDLSVNGTSLFQLAALAPGASNDITNYKDVPEPTQQVGISS